MRIINHVGEKLTEVATSTKETAEEAAFVQQSYRLNEEEAKIPNDSIVKLDQLAKRFEILSSRIEEEASAYFKFTRGTFSNYRKN